MPPFFPTNEPVVVGEGTNFCTNLWGTPQSSNNNSQNLSRKSLLFQEIEEKEKTLKAIQDNREMEENLASLKPSKADVLTLDRPPNHFF